MKKIFKIFLIISLASLVSFLVWRFVFYEPNMYMYGNSYLRGWDKRKI